MKKIYIHTVLSNMLYPTYKKPRKKNLVSFPVIDLTTTIAKPLNNI